MCDWSKDGGCVFDDVQQRRDLITLLLPRISDAGTAYKLALERLRVQELLRKEDELPFFVTLILDLATAHIGSMFARKLMSLRNGTSEAVGNAVAHAEIHGLPQAGGALKKQRALSLVTKERVEGGVKGAMDVAKRGYKTSLSSAGADDRQTMLLDAINVISKQAGIGFDKLRANAAAFLTDAELIVLYDAFAPEHHDIATYQAVLSEKVERFRNTVGVIGRRNAGRDVKIGDDGGVKHNVLRDTAVVWVRQPAGELVLHTLYQDGKPPEGAVVHEGDPGYQAKSFLTFGARDPVAGEQIGPKVEPEFVDLAVRRHLAVWGWMPLTAYAPGSQQWFDDGVHRGRTQEQARSQPKKAATQQLPPTPVKQQQAPKTAQQDTPQGAQDPSLAATPDSAATPAAAQTPQPLDAVAPITSDPP